MLRASACLRRRAAVVVPAHNERDYLPECLSAMVTAALAVPIPVTIVVVLDHCDDGSEMYAGRYGSDVHFVSIDARNVGAARAAGFRYARALGLTGLDTWYATSDADSCVGVDWLARQLSNSADAVLGVVTALNWSCHPEDVVARYERAYFTRVNGEHDHVHGANMGFSAAAYWRIGGFRPLPTGEDVDLVDRLESTGYRISRDSTLSVATSTRTEARAPLGFSHHLRELVKSGAGVCA